MQKICTPCEYKITAIFENGSKVEATLPAMGFGNAIIDFEKQIYFSEHPNKEVRVKEIIVVGLIDEEDNVVSLKPETEVQQEPQAE